MYFFLMPSNVQDDREMLKMSASHVQGIVQTKNMNMISTHNIMQRVFLGKFEMYTGCFSFLKSALLRLPVTERKQQQAQH